MTGGICLRRNKQIIQILQTIVIDYFLMQLIFHNIFILFILNDISLTLDFRTFLENPRNRNKMFSKVKICLTKFEIKLIILRYESCIATF